MEHPEGTLYPAEMETEMGVEGGLGMETEIWTEYETEALSEGTFGMACLHAIILLLPLLLRSYHAAQCSI
jgi:hypothetical protein